MTDKLHELLSMPTTAPHYPQDFESDDRIQIIVAENRFKLLIRHPKYGHWCGYVAVPETEWNRIINLIPTELYDYDGPGSDRICWKDMQHGTMRDVNPFGKIEAMWVGFGDPGVVTDLPPTDLMARLTIFENHVWKLRHAHFAS